MSIISTFRIKTSRGRDVMPNLRVFHHDPENETSGSEGAPVKKIIKILVVDDNPTIQIALTFALRSQKDFEATVVGDSTKVMDLLRDGNFDVLITDTVMPDITGPKLAEMAKQAHPDLKVLAMSDSYTSQAYEAGIADDFIAKPFNVGDLYNKIRGLVK